MYGLSFRVPRKDKAKGKKPPPPPEDGGTFDSTAITFDSTTSTFDATS